MDRITFLALDLADQIRLKNSAKMAQELEDFWALKIKSYLEAFTSEAIRKLPETGKIQKPQLEQLFIEHYFDVSIRSMRYAMWEVEPQMYIAPGTGKKLARLPAARIPKSLADLMRLYDLWRKGKHKPKRQIVEANRVQNEYLKKVRSVWERESEAFRTGDTNTQREVVQAITDQAKTVENRAAMIVRTETTAHYNQARREYYDQSPDITHYLFVAIRDAATSPWCTPKTVNGYRGRSGLVYSKDDPLLKKETPACHWNCRSELLPLNRLNPAHLRFIQNLSLRRERHTCYPLPRGWKAA